MAEVGRRCTATHERYARARGFEHEVVTEYLKSSHPSHQKIRLLADRLPHHEAI